MSNTASEADDLPVDSSDFPTESEGYTISTAYGEEEEYGSDYESAEEVWRTEKFISGPFMSKQCDLEENILQFDHSYGYDCKRYYNLVVADKNTIIFLSGNLINFFDITTKELWFRRSSTGGGLGHITKNPNLEYPHFAVGENGIQPPIIIYEWPSMEIISVLKNGTSRTYSHLNYSPDGTLLVSQGGQPDYMITVWTWIKHCILLRCKSYVNEVHRVVFSPYVPGHLTSCGCSHIKFWKMANTFTGLKLKGAVGRFGKTEYSDILGIYPMPDEKVISGCAWGNILIWDEGLIKLEVYRKGRKKCHDDAIVQFNFKNGELWTVAMDGRVRVWYWETIDMADPPDDDRVVTMEPTYDFETPGAMFMCIRKQDAEIDDTFYFAQDGNGGIWLIDLQTMYDPQPSQRLFVCHAGPIKDMATCPYDHYVATLGYDGKLMLFKYLTKKLFFMHQFAANGMCLIWVPIDIETSGDVLLAAFDDGTIRVLVLNINELEPEKTTLQIMQVIKPHSKSVVAMSINKPGNILVTGGEDSTVFIFKIHTTLNNYLVLIPIGFVKIPAVASCFTWNKDLDYQLIVGCVCGEIIIFEVLQDPQPYTNISYLLDIKIKVQMFTTYKAQIRRMIKMAEIAARKLMKRQKKEVDLAKVKKDNPGLEIDEEIFLADSESEEELEPLHIPEVPNKILWIQHTVNNTLWLSMGGYDAGYIYEYKIGQKSEVPYRYVMVYDTDNIELSSYVYNSTRDYFIVALEHGEIRVYRTNPKDFRDLENYWQLSMHDNQNGFVSRMCFSYDESYFFSCGYDGNVFSYKFHPDIDIPPVSIATRSPKVKLSKQIPVEDKDEYLTLSLEDAIVKNEEDRIAKVADANKAAVLAHLDSLRCDLEVLLTRNAAMAPSQRIPHEELELDPRITENLDEKLNADLQLVERKLAYQLEKSKLALFKMRQTFVDPLECVSFVVTSIHSTQVCYSFCNNKLDNFETLLEEVDRKILAAELKGRPPERPPMAVVKVATPEKREKKIEYFLAGLSPSTIQLKLPPKLNRLLKKYRIRKSNMERRQLEWDIFNALKPAADVNVMDDESILSNAVDTIGDFKLKTSPKYKVPKHLRESTLKKYKELLLVKKVQHEKKQYYNLKLRELQEKKANLRTCLVKDALAIASIHEEIHEKHRKFGPDVFEKNEAHDLSHLLVINVTFPGTEKVIEKSVIIVPEPSGDMLQREVMVTYHSHEVGEEVDIETEWEKEMKLHRYKQKLFEQEMTINKMSTKIKEFDLIVRDYRFWKLELLVEITFLDLHILTLNQELMILKECEAFEDALSEKVNVRILELMDMQDIVTGINNKIDIIKGDIDKLQAKEKELQQMFLNMAQDYKFFDFLRRIFKKKFKPPKVHDVDDSDSDSSSSSSDESEDAGDAGSVDSRDFGIIRLDESVCPKGCDQVIYDKTFQLRTERHQVELEIKELQRVTELLRKEVDTNMKKSKIIENNLKNSQDELETFQREKQQKLNQIMCTVVLKLNQIQNIDEKGNIKMIKDSLVFSKHVLSNLYKRVGELQNETLQQRSKHKVNVLHLARMKTDCGQMNKDIHYLKLKVNDKMKTKFGGPVNLDEVEESILKRLVMELRMSMVDIRSIFEHELSLWAKRYFEKQKIYANMIKSNTLKLELVALLNREKGELVKLLEHQTTSRDKIETIYEVALVFKDEIKNLATVVKRQEEEIKELKQEIKILRTRGYPTKQNVPEIKKHVAAEEEADEDSVYSDWEYVDDYMYTEAYKQEYWAQKRAKEEQCTGNLRDKKLTTEQMILDLILEMLDTMDVCLPRGSTINIVRTVMNDLMNKCNIQQIISDLLSFIPNEPSDQQQSFIEMTAEKLYSIPEEAPSEEEVLACAKDILDEILDEAFENIPIDNVEMVSNLISRLVEVLPLNLLLSNDYLNCICNRLKGLNLEVTGRELLEQVMCRCSQSTEDVTLIINEILQRVYGEGADIMYFIKAGFT